MRIGLLGAGHVGGALGRGWAGHGHQVLFGVRNPAAPKVAQLLASMGPGVGASSIADAAAFGPVVVLAVPWPAVQEVLCAAGDLRGKILIDPTNPVKQDLAGLETPCGASAAEMIASWAPGARVVKAFNTAFAATMADPHFPGNDAIMLCAGGDAEAKAVTCDLAADLGFEPVDAGPLRNAGPLECLGLLSIDLAFTQNQGTGFAWHLLRR